PRRLSQLLYADALQPQPSLFHGGDGPRCRAREARHGDAGARHAPMKRSVLRVMAFSTTLLLIAGCGPKIVQPPPPPRPAPVDTNSIPDAVPRTEPRSAH